MWGVIGFIRDILKAAYRYSIQWYSRLCMVDRERGSSISLSARFDMLPIDKSIKPNRLIINRRAYVESRCVINTWHGDVVLEEGSSLGIGTVVIGPFHLGKYSTLSQACFATGESHKYEDVSVAWQEQGFCVDPIVIKDHVWVGANSVVLPGVTIGSHSVVGAGSVVTKDIPEFSLAVGNPARVIKQFNKESGTWQRINERKSQ